MELDEVVEHFTSQPGELELLRGMAEATRAGLRPDAEVPELDGARFPRVRGEIPDEAVEHVARQVAVPAPDVGLYDWCPTPKKGGGRPERPAQAGAGWLTLVVRSTTASMKP